MIQNVPESNKAGFDHPAASGKIDSGGPSVPEITQERLKELLLYDIKSGIFTWKKRTSGIKTKNLKAGCVFKADGYSRISVDGVKYLSHRLAWLYVTGKHPEGEIDHKNRKRSENMFSNLRDVTPMNNCKNRSRQRNNTSGHAGIHFSKRELVFIARINENGRRKTIGRFALIEDAIKARISEEKRIGYEKEK